jgi:hypothetical protein
MSRAFTQQRPLSISNRISSRVESVDTIEPGLVGNSRFRSMLVSLFDFKVDLDFNLEN